MVPDKFNMVDMGGIDLIMMQGEAVPGLYDKLMAAISNCRYQCLYNWTFDGILIPPTYVQIEVDEDEVYLNEGVSVTSDDVIHIYSIEPPAPEPEIIPLLAEENGTYTVPSGKDGFNPVTVDVPSYTPVITTLSVTENGTYAAPAGVDGYAPVVVNVSSGGVPLLTRAEWNVLTPAQKQAYGLVAIQDYITGYIRGSLYNGAEYLAAKVGDFTPKYSWNASNNIKNTYIFESTTPTNNDTAFCLGVMSQNGNNANWESGLPVIDSGISGSGKYAVVYGAYEDGISASTFSTGDNWNNSEIVCFCLSGDASPIIKEVFYENGQNGTYQYTYQATKSENLLLIAMRGGSAGGSYTITGLTQKSHVTASGARFNDVYFGAVENGDAVNISIPYSAGANNNGCLFVVLMSVEADLQ